MCLVNDPDERYPVSIKFVITNNKKIKDIDFDYPSYHCKSKLKSYLIKNNKIYIQEEMKGVRCENTSYIFSLDKNNRNIQLITNIYKDTEISTKIIKNKFIPNKLSQFAIKHKITNVQDIFDLYNEDKFILKNSINSHYYIIDEFNKAYSSKSKDFEELKKHIKKIKNDNKSKILEKMQSNIGKNALWRAAKQFNTDDCVELFGIKLCMWVTYEYQYRGKVVSIREKTQEYEIEISEAKLLKPNFVSIKYKQNLDRAHEWESTVLEKIKIVDLTHDIKF